MPRTGTDCTQGCKGRGTGIRLHCQRTTWDEQDSSNFHLLSNLVLDELALDEVHYCFLCGNACTGIGRLQQGRDEKSQIPAVVSGTGDSLRQRQERELQDRQEGIQCQFHQPQDTSGREQVQYIGRWNAYRIPRTHPNRGRPIESKPSCIRQGIGKCKPLGKSNAIYSESKQADGNHHHDHAATAPERPYRKHPIQPKAESKNPPPVPTWGNQELRRACISTCTQRTLQRRPVGSN